MITKEEYLKAKALVEEYEKEEYEDGHRKAEEEINGWEDELLSDNEGVTGLTDDVCIQCGDIYLFCPCSY